MIADECWVNPDVVNDVRTAEVFESTLDVLRSDSPVHPAGILHKQFDMCSSVMFYYVRVIFYDYLTDHSRFHRN